MSFPVAVHGTGVAACACVRLLQRRGLQPVFEVTPRSSGPTLLLNQATQRLLADVFDIGGSFFAEFHHIRRRVVRWGSAETVSLVHDGFAVQESVLLEKLWRMTDRRAKPIDDADFHIYSNAADIEVRTMKFGSRCAQSARVEIVASASDACWVEALPNSWLFLIPDGVRTGSLLAIGGGAENVLEGSTLIAPQIRKIVDAVSGIPVTPKIVNPLSAADWLACGSAATTFDPICGEGVGNALREAILASACLANGDPASALAEYAPRLMLGFLKHLNVCRGFYAANRGEWWQRELTQLERGIGWMRDQISAFPPPKYRMVEFDLEPI